MGLNLENMNVEFWTIQHRYNGKGEWTDSNYDNIAKAAYRDSYECWSKYGERGFLSLNTATEALRKVKNDNRKKRHIFRLIRVIVKIKVYPVYIVGERKCFEEGNAVST